MKNFLDLLKATVAEFGEDKASRLGAAIAYYAVFSMAPLLMIVVAVAGLLFGREAVQGQLVGQIGGLVGEQGAELIETMIASASDKSSSLIATIIGTVMLLLGASGVFLELKSALNTIWEVKLKPGRGILSMVKERALLFAMVLGIGFLLIVSLVVSAGLAAMTAFFDQYLPLPGFVIQLIDFGASLGILGALFALMFKVIPDTKIAWRDVWLGGFVTALLFTIGKFAIGFYLGQSAPASSYGAAGALVVILLWAYYSSQIFFFGAEFTKVYATRYGSRAPKAAEPSHERQRVVQNSDPHRLKKGRRAIQAGLAVVVGGIGLAGVVLAKALTGAKKRGTSPRRVFAP